MSSIEWILQGFLALSFLMAGWGKIFGSKMHIESFTRWGYPQWFRVTTGLIEVFAAFLSIVGYWIVNVAIFGAVILIAVGIGGVITHIRAKDSIKEAVLILTLGIIALMLLIFLL